MSPAELNRYPVLPEIDLDGCPLVDMFSDSAQLRRGANLFLDYGFLIVKNVFDPGYVSQLLAEYVDKYNTYFYEKNYSDALKVGDKRTMISMALDGIYNSPEFYANSKLFPFLDPGLRRDDGIIINQRFLR